MRPTISITPYDLAMLAATLDKDLAQNNPVAAVQKAVLLLKAAEEAWENLE